MRVGGIYSFNGGREKIEATYSHEYAEVLAVIQAVDAELLGKKIGAEKRKAGQPLYSPRRLNKAFGDEFARLNWVHKKVDCSYSTDFYTPDYEPKVKKIRPYRDMDFVKNQVGVEIQLGKYSFMVYNVCAKMTIFHNLGFINVGIEVVPLKELAAKMSSGVSYFEQFVWDLEQRGIADIDIPVLILGVIP